MSDDTTGPNVTDVTKREAWRAALRLRIAYDSAKETADSKLGELRSYLKQVAKRGVDPKAITEAFKHRLDDRDVLVVQERERLKMLELSGLFPGLFDEIAGRYAVQEATHEEEEENQVLIAHDRGATAGRAGHSRDTNPYEPGTLGHAKFVEGYLAGQRAIADEMAPEVEPAPATEPAPKKARGRPKKPSAGLFAADTPEQVAAAVREDDRTIPAVLH
jgi:ribosome modulation factor